MIWFLRLFLLWWSPFRATLAVRYKFLINDVHWLRILVYSSFGFGLNECLLEIVRRAIWIQWLIDCWGISRIMRYIRVVVGPIIDLVQWLPLNLHRLWLRNCAVRFLDDIVFCLGFEIIWFLDFKLLFWMHFYELKIILNRTTINWLPF